jgi:heme A synthase
MKRPQPVLNAATVASVVTALVSILVTLGFVSAEDGAALSNSAATLMAGIIAAVAVVAHIVAALRAREQVTPIESPQAADGRPLS